MNHPEKESVLSLAIEEYVERRNNEQDCRPTTILESVLSRLGFEGKPQEYPHYFLTLGSIIADGMSAYKAQFLPKSVDMPEDVAELLHGGPEQEKFQF